MIFTLVVFLCWIMNLDTCVFSPSLCRRFSSPLREWWLLAAALFVYRAGLAALSTTPIDPNEEWYLGAEVAYAVVFRDGPGGGGVDGGWADIFPLTQFPTAGLIGDWMDFSAANLGTTRFFSIPLVIYFWVLKVSTMDSKFTIKAGPHLIAAVFTTGIDLLTARVAGSLSSNPARAENLALLLSMLSAPVSVCGSHYISSLSVALFLLAAVLFVANRAAALVACAVVCTSLARGVAVPCALFASTWLLFIELRDSIASAGAAFRHSLRYTTQWNCYAIGAVLFKHAWKAAVVLGLFRLVVMNILDPLLFVGPRSLAERLTPQQESMPTVAQILVEYLRSLAPPATFLFMLGVFRYKHPSYYSRSSSESHLRWFVLLSAVWIGTAVWVLPFLGISQLGYLTHMFLPLVPLLNVLIALRLVEQPWRGPRIGLLLASFGIFSGALWFMLPFAWNGSSDGTNDLVRAVNYVADHPPPQIVAIEATDALTFEYNIVVALPCNPAGETDRSLFPGLHRLHNVVTRVELLGSCSHETGQPLHAQFPVAAHAILMHPKTLHTFSQREMMEHHFASILHMESSGTVLWFRMR